MSEGVNLFYSSIEEKREHISIINYKSIYDYFLEKVIYKVNSPKYRMGDSYYFDTKKFKMPIKLRSNEYFIIHCWDSTDTIYGNIMEREYLEDFFPEIFKIENRMDVINDIINGV